MVRHAGKQNWNCCSDGLYREHGIEALSLPLNNKHGVITTPCMSLCSPMVSCWGGPKAKKTEHALSITLQEAVVRSMLPHGAMPLQEISHG